MFKAFFNDIEIDLSKRNKTLAAQFGVDDADEFTAIRKMVQKTNVYTCLDPYNQDIKGQNTLMIETDPDILHQQYNNALSDI